jgi:predicted nucleic acid-binding protein
MIDKYFLDTNFLVYLFSEIEIEKSEKCSDMLSQLSNHVQFVLSTQVINEFSNIAISKFHKDAIDVKSIIDILSEFEIVINDVDIIKKGIDIKFRYQLSFWDSLIISAAKSAKCNIIVSEDLQDGQVIEGVKIQNPFIHDLINSKN